MFRGAVCRLYAPLHRVLQSCTSHGEASVVSCGHLPRMIAEISVASSFRFSIPYRRFFSKKRNASSDEDGNDIFSVSSKNPESPPKLFVVQPRLRPDSLLQAKLSEALNLANSLEEQRDGFYAEDFGEKKVPPHIIVQNPLIRSSRAHADTYFGPGTVENVKVHVRVSEEKDEINAIFVNSMLSGAQQRNLELAWEKPVLDRVGLIIEIFNAHAQTKEAKLQSELAALMYKKTRLVRIRGPGGRLTFGALGEAQVVSARGRASGGRGFISGAGESELHLQRRRIQERRVHLLEQIEEVRRTRALQRAYRKRHGGSDGGGLATVAVVGYTNAGKSTLVSALSQSDVYSDDRLFATVDPRLRHVILPSGKKVILSDTVGFISDLPVQLVEAFHATLEEVVEADLLVHVLDSSAKDLEEQKSTVLQVLHRIGVSPEKIQNMIEVWNKIDLLEGEGDGGGLLLEESEFSEDEFELDEGDEVNANDDMEEVNAFSDENEEVSSSGHSTEEEPTDDSSSESQRFTFEECILSNEDSQPVKTAALLGVGLQELLLLIDEKLDSQNTFQERDRDSSGLFYRKWRPPRFRT